MQGDFEKREQQKKARHAAAERVRRFYQRLKADFEADSEEFLRAVMQQIDHSKQGSMR
jgi:hypothetical protein